MLAGPIGYVLLYNPGLDLSQIAPDVWLFGLFITVLGAWILYAQKDQDWVVAIKGLPDGGVCFLVWTPFGRRRRIWYPGQPRMTVTYHENIKRTSVDPFFELKGWGKPLRVDAWGRFPQGVRPLLPLTNNFPIPPSTSKHPTSSR